MNCVNEGKFPEKAMILSHTLWTDDWIQWNMLHFREFFRNNLKYMAKNNRIVAKLYKKMVDLYWKK